MSASTRLILGEPYPNWNGMPTDGLQFQIVGNHAMMRLAFTQPRASEVTAFNDAPIHIGLLRASETLLFFLARIGGLTDGWSDSPFALGMLPPSDRLIMQREGGQGLALVATFVDRQDGTIVGMRIVSMSPAFCQVLDQMLCEQRAQIDRFTPTDYANEVEASYLRWPHSNQMAAIASIIERAGAPFG